MRIGGLKVTPSGDWCRGKGSCRGKNEGRLALKVTTPGSWLKERPPARECRKLGG